MEMITIHKLPQQPSLVQNVKLETERKKTTGNCLIDPGWDENAGQEMVLQIRHSAARARQGIIVEPLLTVTFTSANNGA